MTNKQLKAHCEDVIANPQDHLDWVLSDEMAMAFHRALSDSALGSDELEEIKIGLRAAILNYAPPAPELKPIELPDCVDDLHGVGPVMSAEDVERAIRAAGYEVKS